MHWEGKSVQSISLIWCYEMFLLKKSNVPGKMTLKVHTVNQQSHWQDICCTVKQAAKNKPKKAVKTQTNKNNIPEKAPE